MNKMTSKDIFNVGDTVRLKSTLKVDKIYDDFTFLSGMDYGFERLTVVYVDRSQSLELLGPDGETWWYSLAMLDMRTIRRKRNDN